MRIRAYIFAAITVACTCFAERARADDVAAQRGRLFDQVVKVMQRSFYDEPTRTTIMPELAARFRDQALAAATLDAERAVVQQMLGEIPASHLGLLSKSAHRQMMRNLEGRSAPTFGFELAQIGEAYFVVGVLEGGPAEHAGLRRGDRVLTLDGVAPPQSPRLDWRSDDAALPDAPLHAILAEKEDRLIMAVERREGEQIEFDVVARDYSALAAAKASAKVVEVEGHRIAVVHFWFIHSRGMDAMLEKLIANDFKEAEALVLDLRGRGGSAEMVTRVLKILAGRNSKWKRPIVALIDQNTRSAKEMLAWELKSRKLAVLVGQTTAGALLPATFADVGDDTVLMYPAFQLGKYSAAIEGQGVAPDISAESPLPLSAGADPIREAGLAAAAALARERAIARQPA